LGVDPEALKPAFNKLFSGNWKQGSIPEKWDGKTGERIVEHLVKILDS
jgi:UDP-N-acetylglucosamine 2-epimerase (non-hydrolysing)